MNSTLSFPLMNPLLRRAVALVLAAGAAFAASGCRRPAGSGYQGYLEAEYVHVGAPVPGTLRQRPVARGDAVTNGTVLFVLEGEAEEAAVTEAERRLAQTRSRLDNLLKGRRPSEIASLEARVAQARATRDLADLELERRRKLRRDDVISAAELDIATSQRTAAQAAVEVAEADLATARLGGREDEIRGAEAERDAAEAALARARWSRDQKTQRSTVSGRIHDTYHEPGEFVATGNPVVSILPPDRIKARFYVPEADLPHLPVGTPVEIVRDGAGAPLKGRVSYLATRPEFTPPVIYSRSTRAKLVFLVEAALRPEDTAGLAPGQPVDVHPVTGTPPTAPAGTATP